MVSALMRATLIAGACALLATPAAANEFVRHTGKIILYVPSGTQDESEVPTVARGEEFGVNCGCFKGPNADVRVVLSLGHVRGEAPTGYEALLATDETVDDHGGVRVRVPDAPGLAHHTVHVRIYVLDSKGAHAFDAGTVRIT